MYLWAVSLSVLYFGKKCFCDWSFFHKSEGKNVGKNVLFFIGVRFLGGFVSLHHKRRETASGVCCIRLRLQARKILAYKSVAPPMISSEKPSTHQSCFPLSLHLDLRKYYFEINSHSKTVFRTLMVELFICSKVCRTVRHRSTMLRKGAFLLGMQKCGSSEYLQVITAPNMVFWTSISEY